MLTLPQILGWSTCTLVASLLLHWYALRLFPRWKLLDFPERYGLQRERIPYPTGILAVSLFLLLFALVQPSFASPWSLQHMGLFAATLLLGITSFIDDRDRLSPKLRIVIHILCGVIIFGTGTRIYSLTNPLEALTGIPRLQLDTYVIRSSLLSDPSLIGALFTVLWLGLTMNALNWFDGIPGQVSVLAVIGFVTIGFLSLSARVNQPELAFLSFLLASIALGGLLFDLPPATALMGDTGAMFYGLLLGVLTIYAGGKVATAFLVLGVPLIDFAIVIFRRVLHHSPILQGGDNEHLHHRLLAKGWSQRQVILLTAVLGSTFGVSALFLSTVQKFIAALILFGVMLTLSRYAQFKTHENS
ncbi:hypothetical protein COU76_01185 [Candidatus Peregrinibacteria bacterium CG10_big_fil_rev_8_21_14_0_10_49_10]|nr:MAG: hypothetical protein COU76_01185 [Candidatus Peregrinibacteria bacterium CG10_big_fil_rev_8_21_14_0_10_49_10]